MPAAGPPLLGFPGPFSMPAAAEPSPAEVERLMSDPRVRELQYKLAHGGEKFKLEVR